jgi:ubiquinone/menaquinone biosynthesis C-methylase UbiE
LQPHAIPSFAPRSADDLAADKYEDRKQRYAEGYVAEWAFGYLFLKRGEAEGFYRTINELGFTANTAGNKAPLNILEIGCGVGRTTCDYARHFPDAFVIGLDYSPNLLSHAYQMVIGEPSQTILSISLEPEGHGTVSAPTFGLENACFVQASALNLPFAADQFDLVVSPNLIDRVPDPGSMVAEASRVVRPGGSLIIADPFNWTARPDLWGQIRAVGDLTALMERHGLTVDLAFDGLVYREIRDVRGAYTDWPVAVARAVKP